MQQLFCAWCDAFLKQPSCFCQKSLWFVRCHAAPQHVAEHTVMQAGWSQALESLCLNLWLAYQSYRTTPQPS